MISTLSDALAERGFDTLTDVQKAVSDPALTAADLLVSAQTGSGKTVGFGLAIAPTLMGDAARLGPPAAPLALIVAPTRELAMQVARELGWLYGKAGARVVTCIGGMDAREERRALDRGAHIVVGTPGRLCDHINRGALDLADIRAVVLDEADEMLDLGFREDLEFILGKAPEGRRTLLFSATVPPAIATLAQSFQRDAVRISTVSKGSQHADITYQAVQVAAHDIEHGIINLLRYHAAPTAIVFANTRAAVARLTARLANRGMAVVSLSGELSQDERSHALQAMRDGRAKVCVATDVAARGIDLPNLDLVIHADLPTNTEALLHRSGRTGRAGRKGRSVLIVPDKASNKATRLLKWAKITAEWVPAPSAEAIRAQDEARLLDDAAWSDSLTEEESGFAAKLLAAHTPEVIAAACLRLYRAQLSAPEELNSRPATATAAPRDAAADFGPSGWITLSIGRDKGAEPRWLLPLLCRAGGLEKSQIGKIRVQDTETQVELSAPAVAGFLSRLGANGVLENDVRAMAQGQAPAPNRPKSAAPPVASRPEPATPAAKPPRPPKNRKPAFTPKSADAPKPRAKPEERRKPASQRGPDAKPRKSKDFDAPKAPEGKPSAPPSKPKGRPNASDPSKSLGRPRKQRGLAGKGGNVPPRRKS